MDGAATALTVTRRAQAHMHGRSLVALGEDDKMERRRLRSRLNESAHRVSIMFSRGPGAPVIRASGPSDLRLDGI